MQQTASPEPLWYVTAYGENYYQAYKDQYSPEETRAEVDGIVSLLELGPGARVLDVSCGFGRHSVELAKRGFQVTGLDLSPHLLAHAREAAERDSVQVTWIEADMRDIPVPDTPYDAAVSVFSSFGLLGTDDDEMQVARAIQRVLAPQGKVLIETVNREIMLRRWASSRWREQPDGALVCERLKFDATTGIVHTTETTVLPDGRRVRSMDQLRLWSFSELALLLRVCGFEKMAPFGGLDGKPYTWDTYRMVVVGRKASEVARL